MSRHRYTRPGKAQAFETAQRFARTLSDHLLLAYGWAAHTWLTANVQSEHPHVPIQDIKHVAATALRLERGTRRQRNHVRSNNNA